MKKNKLYTVNQWNQPAFMQGVQGHIFDGTSEPSNQMFRPSVNFYNGMKPLIQNAQANQAQSLLTSNTPQTRSIGGASGADGGKSKKGGSGWMAAIPAATNVLGSIETGDKRGMWDTLDPMYHLSGGRESKVGDSFSDTGVMLTQAGLSSGNPWLALAGAASKVVGDLTNAAFGLKIDHKRLDSINEGVGIAKNFTSDASSFDDIKGPVAIANADGVYKGGWFSGDKAVKKNAELLAQRSNAVNWMDRGILNNINNITEDRMSDNLGNYAAFGGLLDQYDGNMGAIEYGLISDYLTQKKRENNMKSKMGGTVTIPAFMPNSYAIGGDLQTNGADWSTGATHIDAGKSHEENPNEGVQLGVDSENVPNLVEEGEVVWNDYVFSNRIVCDEETKKMFHIGKKQEITYADLAKRLEKEIAERPNDPISKSGFNAQMQQLEEQQERQKQEMETKRAEKEFEALSPEEKVAAMTMLQQREQGVGAEVVSQPTEEEMMAQQQMAQQMSPEEMAMMQQQQGQMADGSGAVLGQEPEMNAEGGKINRFDLGGKAYTRMLNSLGFHTQKEFDDWAKENNIDLSKVWSSDDRILSNDILSNLWKDENFKKALKAKNPALAHAFSERGYDWGAYSPEASGVVSFDDDRGNWDAQTVQGWWGSNDPAWKQVIEAHPELTKDTNLSREQLAEYLRNTDAFKKGTQWLQDSEDNRLAYLQRIINNPNAPKRAKEYALRFATADGWKQGAARDYETIFNNPSGRAANPGTYWKTPIEAVRGSQSGNYVINDDGTIEEIIGNVPTDWTSAGNYVWADADNDYTYNYYTRPGYVPTTNTTVREGEASKSPVGTDTGNPEQLKNDRVTPKHRAGWLRYAGLFGPAVGFGLQALGIGKPDTSAIDAAIAGAGNVNLARWKPLGNYLTYRPLDIWYQQNALNAQSRATDRALLNAAGANSGAAMAGLLSNGYNSQIASGNLFRQAQEYNDALRNQVAQFNRGTDQFNSEQFGVTSRFNADARNNANRAYAQLRLGAASQKADMNAGWNQGIYGNVSGLFKGIGDMGRENEQYNWLSDLAADGYFGNLGNSNTGKRWVRRTAAKGGKLKKKGLTI